MLTSLRVQGYRSADDTGELPLGPVTVMVGRNNSGKSTLLRAVYLVQDGAPWTNEDQRLGAPLVRVELGYDRLPVDGVASEVDPVGTLIVSRSSGGQAKIQVKVPRMNEPSELRPISSNEPNNLIFPTLAGRRHVRNEEQVRRDQTTMVHANDQWLASRASRLSDPNVADAIEYRKLCQRVLEQDLSVLPGQNGHRIGIQVDRYLDIGLDAMGTGVTAVLGLLLNLTGAHGKVFIIEEPESDLHPKALKALLDVIIEKSIDNQFLISTHSSSVLLRLGALDSTVVLQAHTNGGRPPTSSYTVVQGRDARLDVLRDLGYELADLDLAEGWLIFEESSAERVCRDYLIPWFAPGLRALRTVAAAGTSRVEPLVHDYAEMLLFAHLSGPYQDRAWVVVDGDEAGTAVIKGLRGRYTTWPKDRFSQWSRPGFEMYYPPIFADRATAVLSFDHKQRHAAKKTLCDDVLVWIASDEEQAKAALEESASEVIEHLRQIEASLTAITQGTPPASTSTGA